MLTKEELIRYADRFRANPVPSELKAIQLLKDMGFKGNTMLFQKPFGYYILDFVIPSKCLVIEIDGLSHEHRLKYDARRDMFCNKAGLRVLRISNDRVDELPALVTQYSDIPNYKDKMATAYGYAAEQRTYSEKHKPSNTNAYKHKKKGPYKSKKPMTGWR